MWIQMREAGMSWAPSEFLRQVLSGSSVVSSGARSIRCKGLRAEGLVRPNVMGTGDVDFLLRGQILVSTIIVLAVWTGGRLGHDSFRGGAGVV
jgi:hypothetical protein